MTPETTKKQLISLFAQLAVRCLLNPPKQENKNVLPQN